ncbi:MULTISPECIES: MMPL family transporter [unclassified Neptuniibacter]|uniref:efflux RND transporter permease subunit n=1 Tax=unclassified Neptuniibacter TaxID=2630693 RepID=UPI000C3D94CC|nr:MULTISPECIES: MMPL family transporter [unclassified Neptuniibacter]MAY43168.1 RND transporter [Oceanospirillaceae bacterium]|tara:strand:- start:10515 stop:12899 length:2385 start_codon:yes stop_codon:yes gene_type:complete
MKERLFRFVLDHPVWVILLTMLFVFGSAYGAKNLVFKSDYRVFFSEENPQLTAFESMQKIYSKSDNVAFIISPNDGEVFTPKTLKAIQELTTESWQIPFSTRVDSITNFQHTWSEEDDMFVEDLVLDAETVTEADMPRLKEIAVNEPLLVHKIISPEAHVTVVNVTVQLPGVNPVEEVPQAVAKAREMKAQFIAQNPDITVHLSGMVMMNNSFAESSLTDNATLVPIMFGVVLLGMIFLLRTFSGTFATVIIIIFTIISTMGLAGHTGFYLTGPSSTTPIMVLTLAVADCIHILTTMFYEMRQGVEKKKAIQDSLRINFQPIFLTSVTTAIGFLSLNFSDSPPFRDLGNMVAAGVMLAFVFSITLFPAMLSLLPIRVKQFKEGKNDIMHRLADFVVGKRKILLPGMSVLMVCIIAFTPQNELNDDFVKYFDETVPFRQATDYMQDNLSGMSTMEISIETGESSGINDPKFLHSVGNLTEWLRAQPETDHVNSLSDIIKRLNKNMHGDDPSYYKLPTDRELSAQYLLLYEMSLPYGLDLNNQLNVDKSSTRVIATFRNLTSTEQIEIEERIYAWFADNASSYEVEIASPNLMFAHIGQRNIVSMLLGTTIALVLISLILGFALKSVKFGFISLIPNIAPAAMGFGVWYLIDGQIGLALSVVAGMTLGIIVDDTVHFLSKYLHARRERNKDPKAAVSYAFASVGRALWVTTIVLVAGFMVLAQSSFKLNADMGLLTAVTIFIALVVDFLFLPALLMKLDKDSQPESSSQSKGTPTNTDSSANTSEGDDNDSVKQIA